MVIDGTRMLIGLFIGIAILIVLVLKTRVHTFLALIITTVIVGLIGGMPFAATEVTNAAGEPLPLTVNRGLWRLMYVKDRKNGILPRLLIS